MYQADVGRWGVVDALADDPNQLNKSPYAYAWNNPTNLIDPDGNCPYCPDAIKREIENAFAPVKDAVESTIDFAGDVVDKIGEGIDKAIEVMTPKYGEELTSENGGVDPTTEKREIVGQQTNIDDLSAAAGGAGAGPLTKPSGLETLGKVGEFLNHVLKVEYEPVPGDSGKYYDSRTGGYKIGVKLSPGGGISPVNSRPVQDKEDSIKYNIH